MMDDAPPDTNPTLLEASRSSSPTLPSTGVSSLCPDRPLSPLDPISPPTVDPPTNNPSRLSFVPIPAEKQDKASRDSPPSTKSSIERSSDGVMPPPAPLMARGLARRRVQRVVWMHSEAYLSNLAKVPTHENRDVLFTRLVQSIGLDRWLTTVAPSRAAASHLKRFHDSEYVDTLLASDPARSGSRLPLPILDEYGLVDDCAVFPGVWNYSAAVSGASLQAADLLARGQADVCMNWGGGRHHAHKAEAAGYCYTNDIVLSTLHLLRRFRRVLYLDIDLHHGDAVQDAFYFTSSVLHVSFHKWARGFYPGTGVPTQLGEGPGKFFNLNLPLKDGCGDATFLDLFSHTLNKCVETYRPDAIVMQCGADTLSNDPMKSFNLTSEAVASAVRMVSRVNKPLLLLGGGGYNPVDTARTWCAATAAAMGDFVESLVPELVPEHEYFELYGPSFEMATEKNPRPDENTVAYLQKLRNHVDWVLGKLNEQQQLALISDHQARKRKLDPSGQSGLSDDPPKRQASPPADTAAATSKKESTSSTGSIAASALSPLELSESAAHLTLECTQLKSEKPEEGSPSSISTPPTEEPTDAAASFHEEGAGKATRGPPMPIK